MCLLETDVIESQYSSTHIQGVFFRIGNNFYQSELSNCIKLSRADNEAKFTEMNPNTLVCAPNALYHIQSIVIAPPTPS